MQSPKIGTNISNAILKTARATFRSALWNNDFMFLLRFDDQSASLEERVLLVRGLTYTTHGEGEQVEQDDIMRVPQELVQELLDAAWKAGLRPKNWKYGNIEAHFEDLRKIAFALSGVVKP